MDVQHRDLKSPNVLLQMVAGVLRAKVANLCGYVYHHAGAMRADICRDMRADMHADVHTDKCADICRDIGTEI